MKLSECGIEQGRLRIDIEDGRRRAFQAERKSPRLAQARSENELWDEIVAALAICREGMLCVGRGHARRRRVRECQLDGVLQGERFGGGLQGCDQT